MSEHAFVQRSAPGPRPVRPVAVPLTKRSATRDALRELQIGPPGDRFEREADRIAEVVVRDTAPAPAISSPSPVALQRMCGECEQEERKLRRQAMAGGSSQDWPGAPSEDRPRIAAPDLATLPSGHPLPGGTRSFFEGRLGYDLRRVQIHTDQPAADAAAALRARAFTIGSDIFFGAGRFAPATAAGQHLLAHELVHTIQQRAGVGPSADAPAVTPAPARIQRSEEEDGPEEGAGTCVGYGTARETGTEAHRAIGRRCGCKGPPLPGGGAGGGTGYLDLFRTWPPRDARQMGFFGPDASPLGKLFGDDTWVAEIGEIKPDSWMNELGLFAALDQLKRYIDAYAKSYGPGNRLRLPVTSVIPMVTFRGIPEPGIMFGRDDQLLTCRRVAPGIYVYSCKRRKKQEEEKERAAQKSAALPGSQKEQQSANTAQIASMLRERAPWLPSHLAEAVAAMDSGVRRLPEPVAWPGNFPGTVVAYVNKSGGTADYQVYQEYPEDPAFYANLKTVRAESWLNRDWKANLLQTTFTTWNRDLWSLIEPREPGQLYRASPDYARAELRGIYEQIFKLIVGGSAAILGSGVAVSQINNIARQAATKAAGGRAILRELEKGAQVPERPSQVIPFPGRGPAGPSPGELEELQGLLKTG